MPQKIGTSPRASFSEVLETCMRSNSCSASGARMLPVKDLQAPFIPTATSSRSESPGNMHGRILISGCTTSGLC